MSDIRFIVGEEVSFLNEPGKAIVKAVLPDGNVRIETEDGFEMDYPASVLVPRFDLRQQQAEAVPEVEEEQGPILEMGGFRVGMQVQVIDQAETALILSFSEEGMAELEFEDIFTKRFPISQLVAVDTLQLKEIEKSVEQVTLRDIGESPKPLHMQRTLKDRKDQGAWEVDLHVQELVDNSHGMMKHEIVQLQLDHFDKKLNEAIERGVNKIIFIHGRGEGRLRTAIREVLKRYPNCEYLDADYRRYGVGATEVRVKYRPRTEED